MITTWTYLLVAVGGALGSVARFWASGWVASRWGETFPWGTLVVNASGSFLIGFLSTITQPDGRFWVSPETRTFFLVGLCGGYTTFSSFSLQTMELLRDGEWLYAGGNVILSVAICFGAVWLGHVLAVALSARS